MMFHYFIDAFTVSYFHVTFLVRQRRPSISTALTPLSERA
jgi:hypothetical protein